MSVETLISVEEYLNTSYDPDVEYVDGVLVERNAGDILHSWVQKNVVVAFDRKYPDVEAFPEVRCQTTATRYRLPDVSVILSVPDTKYLLEPPFIAIEILSEDDRTSRTIEKLQEYRDKGVPHTWLIDPRLKSLFVFEPGVLRQVEVFVTEDPRLELTREEIFRRVP